MSTGINERGREPAKALEITQAVLRQVFEKAIKVGHTILKNGDTVVVYFRLPVEIKYRASPDHGIQGHQLPFIRAGKLRPAVAAVFIPESGDGLMDHMMVPAKMKRGKALPVQQP